MGPGPGSGYTNSFAGISKSLHRLTRPKGKLDALRKNARGNSGPWATHPAEMSAKSAVLRLAKLLPIDNATQGMMARAEYEEEGTLMEAPEIPAEVLKVDDWNHEKLDFRVVAVVPAAPAQAAAAD